MQRVVKHRHGGRGLVLLGASLQGWQGVAPTVGVAALLLELAGQLRHVRGLQVPYAEVERAEQRLRRHERWAGCYRDAAPVPWEAACWVVVLHEPETPALATALAVFEREAQSVEFAAPGATDV